MLRQAQCVWFVSLTILVTPACFAGTATDWEGDIFAADTPGGFVFGAKPGRQDGYDGQSPIDFTSRPGVYIQLYRANGATWTGPTGFYYEDYESPIPPGGSKTWPDIYLWSYNYTPIHGNRAGTSLTRQRTAPVGWWGKLVLDYWPADLNWTGATEWWFRLYGGAGGYGVPALPCPITDDPFNPDNVTRLHLEVYTTPEPSSLAGIGLALAGLVPAGFVQRRRR